MLQITIRPCSASWLTLVKSRPVKIEMRAWSMTARRYLRGSVAAGPRAAVAFLPRLR